MNRPPLWLVGWSDSEDEDYRAAWAAAELEAEIARVKPLGPTVGRRRHRLRSWPASVRLATRARGWQGPVIAWDPVAGALAALAGRRDVVLLNPLLDPASATLRRRVLLAGARRAARVLFFSRAAARDAVRLGLPRESVGFLPLGVRARRDVVTPPGDHLLAVGRERRDWDTLARAAQGLDLEVRVLGPDSAPPPLRVLEQVDRGDFLDLVAAAAAVVVPLLDDRRTAGQLAVLDALSVGRAVVASRAPGTEDYVNDQTGVLVPIGDAHALREALERVAEPTVARAMGEAGLRAAQGPFALERFVRDVHAEAHGERVAEDVSDSD